jgi:hypothetical membrane protein
MRQMRRAVALWALASAVAAPTVLLAASAVARLMRTAKYDPITQSISELANGRSDAVMTAGIVLSSLFQIVTAAGLYTLRLRARVALAFAGCCGLALAGLPVSQQSTMLPHLIIAGFGATALAVSPLLAISAEGSAPAVCRPRWAIVASVVLVALLMWVFAAMRRGGDLGLAERLAASTELMWPLTVAVAAWLSSSRNPNNTGTRL